MNILHCWLMNFAPKESGKKHESITKDKIIQKHQKIINFSKNIENLYTYIALLQFASNTIMICSLAFLIVSVSKKWKLKYYILMIATYRRLANERTIALIYSLVFYNTDEICK